MKKLKVLSLFSLIATAVIGCGNGNNSSSFVSTNSSSNKVSSSISTSIPNNVELPTDYKVNSYYEAMKILSELKNYTINVTYMEGAYESKNNVYFTENAIFDDYAGDEYGYIALEEGVVFVDYYENNLIASEVLLDENGNPYTSVWNKKFFTSFADINLKEFEKAGNDVYFDITGKANKIQFMNLVYAQQTDYENIISITAYLGENLSDLMFSLEFKGGFGYSIEISDINQTKIDVIDEFIESGKGATVISDDLKRVKNLFAGFNYKRVLYFENDEGETKVAGHEYFNPDYFFSRFVDEYKMIDPSVAFDAGYIGFNNKIVEGMHLDGAYYAYIIDGQASIFPQAAYYDYDITKFYNYPTYMTLFTNLHYFNLVEGTEHSYRTTNFDLTLDFVNNMQLSEILAGYYVDGLTITLEDAENDEDARVIFTLEYSTDGVAGGDNSATADFEFIEFGLANVLEFDLIINSAIDAE